MVMVFKHVPLWPSNILLLGYLFRHAFLQNPRVHALWLQPEPLQARAGWGSEAAHCHLLLVI